MGLYTVVQNVQEIPEELQDKCRFLIAKATYNKRGRFSRAGPPLSESCHNPNTRKEHNR
jgi:hypothetical protein